MVSKTLSLALLCLAVSAVQASSMKDLAVEYSQMLAEQLSAGVEEVERLKGSAFDQVSKHRQDTLTQLVASAKDKVEQQATDCKPAAKEEVHHVITESVTDRFLHCINFTDKITDLEKLVLNVSTQIGFVEDGVCLAITNLTSCGGEGIIEEIHCVSSGLLTYINDFSQHSSNIKNIVVQFNQVLEAIGTQFLKCFTTVDNDATEFIQQTIKAKC